jgi:uracil-DNA glycosylase
MTRQSFPALLREIRVCQICAAHLPHEPRPVLRAKPSARIVIAGQAPGTRVHASGMPFTDPSGDRLRDWLGVDSATFYDDTKVAIVPMGFCFPGLDAKGGDLPPRKECAPAWREKLFAGLKEVELTLLVGLYSQAWHLGDRRKETLTGTVKAWRSYGPQYIPLPHPSWRNNAWVKKNPWFEEELLPHLRRRVSRILKA